MIKEGFLPIGGEAVLKRHETYSKRSASADVLRCGAVRQENSTREKEAAHRFRPNLWMHKKGSGGSRSGIDTGRFRAERWLYTQTDAGTAFGRRICDRGFDFVQSQRLVRDWCPSRRKLARYPPCWSRKVP